MALLTLSIGSNIDAASNVRSAMRRLFQRFPDLRHSPVYESEAVGFDGDNFLNLVMAVDTDAELADIVSFCKELEDEHGRDRSGPRFSGRTLDIDVLTFGDSDGAEAGLELPRDEITRHAFVLKPLSDLLPHMRLPGSDERIDAVWRRFKVDDQPLWQVPFDWQDVFD